MQTPSGFAERAQKHLARRIAFFTALIIALIIALLIASILKARHGALARARLEASYRSSALVQDVEGRLNIIACASEFVKQRIERGGDTGILPELKELISKNSPALTSISIIGVDGQLRATSVGFPTTSAVPFITRTGLAMPPFQACLPHGAARPVSNAPGAPEKARPTRTRLAAQRIKLPPRLNEDWPGLTLIGVTHPIPRPVREAYSVRKCAAVRPLMTS
jgi:hypothetical protein